MNGRIVGVLFSTILIASIVFSFFGLAYRFPSLSCAGLALFIGGFLLLFAVLYRRMKKAGVSFWFSDLILGLSSFNVLSGRLRFGVPKYLEGSLLLGLFLALLFPFGNSISGAFSYVSAELAGQVWFFLADTGIILSIVKHYASIDKFRHAGKLFKDDIARGNFLEDVEKAQNFVRGRFGALAFLAGAVLVNLVSYRANLVDRVYENTVFYVTETYDGPWVLIMVQPPSVLGSIAWHISTSIIWGLLALAALMTVVTFWLMTHLDSDSPAVGMELDTCDPWPVRQVTQVLTSFWMLTSSGLLILPLLAILASVLGGAGRHYASHLFSMEVYYYPVFLVSFFIMSSLRVKGFVSDLKAKAAERIYAELKNARSDPLKMERLAIELSLVERVPEGPPGTAFMQLFQIVFAVGLALLSLYLR